MNGGIWRNKHTYPHESVKTYVYIKILPLIISGINDKGKFIGRAGLA